ncbi:MAG: GNAT family N-acetyltransferase [Candidatus Abyssobacteria bacterium SURF_5]|uniref:GNAT family N-acetyltransferase n=1 Tax=Abyssobacteria bacterium (strain SURF_5) TaxID=2093360 RepID=A0A3A4NWZ9_ABYX5|nr:MAG: GNAT family N-acetyltransferase [Candidatus Abyssubacteria bacterium SURF_5]
MPADVALSAIDEQRFGFRVARASNVTAEDLHSILDFCHKKEIVLLIARCATSELRAAQTMEAQGFLLMDTLMYYQRKSSPDQIPSNVAGDIVVRPFEAGEEDAVAEIAAKSFEGYQGHYHCDERLDPIKCNEIYTSWARRSCVVPNLADQVIIAELDGVAAGFATLRLASPEVGEGVLFGVSPSAQGRGIYRYLMIEGMKWCLDKRAERMVVSTQITNIAVQKVWSRLGFEPSYSSYTFHKWFDK